MPRTTSCCVDRSCTCTSSVSPAGRMTSSSPAKERSSRARPSSNPSPATPMCSRHTSVSGWCREPRLHSSTKRYTGWFQGGRTSSRSHSMSGRSRSVMPSRRSPRASRSSASWPPSRRSQWSVRPLAATFRVRRATKMSSARSACRDRLVSAGSCCWSLPVAVGGAAVAVVGAVLASPAMPIGLARRAEPNPGFVIDGWVVTVGFVTVAAVVVGSAALSGWAMARGPRSLPGPPGQSVATTAALRLGAGPVSATGVRLAFDRRPPALSVRSALGGATVAVLGMTAVLTFSASLDRLGSSPGRWGYPWDLMLNFTSAEVDRAADKLNGDETLAGVARWDSGFSYINGEGVRAFGLTPLRGEVGFSLRSGDQPARVDEIVIGPATAQRLAVTVGDRVGVAAGSDGNPATAHVVGIALFPEIDNGNLTDGIGYYRSAFADHATVPDLFEAFQLVVRVAPGQGERRHCQPDRPISWVRVGRERPRTSRQRREPARFARAALVARRIRRRVGAGITGARPRHHAGAPPTRAGDATQPRPDPSPDGGLHRVAGSHDRRRRACYRGLPRADRRQRRVVGGRRPDRRQNRCQQTGDRPDCRVRRSPPRRDAGGDPGRSAGKPQASRQSASRRMTLRSFDSSNHRGGRDGVQRRARTTSGAQRQPAPTGISPPVIRRSMTGRVGIVPGMFGYLPVAAVRRAIRVAIDAHSERRTRTMGSTNSSGGIRPREEKLELEPLCAHHCRSERVLPSPRRGAPGRTIRTDSGTTSTCSRRVRSAKDWVGGMIAEGGRRHG